MQKTLVDKGMIFTIVWLFVGLSIVSSTGNVLENTYFHHCPIESINISEEKLSWETTVYTYIDGPLGTGFYAFGPGNITRFREWEGDDFFSAGTWTNDGRFLCCMYGNGTLYDIDPKTFDVSIIGNGGASLTGLAYNPVNEKLYGASTTALYEINMETGEQEYIGDFTNSMYMMAIAFDLYGVLYGWDISTDCLYTIDTETGEATGVGSLGYNLNYNQDGSFDMDDDILYLVAYLLSPYGSYLLRCNKDTGACTIIESFEAYAFAISYELNMTPPITNISLNPQYPNGNNGWYISNVSVELTATDNTGVLATYYRINGGEWELYESPFIISEDGEHTIEFYSIDYVGNIEDSKSFTIDMDQTKPLLDSDGVHWEAYQTEPFGYWYVRFWTNAADKTSGMNRVEFYLNEILQITIIGPGPIYEWVIPWLENYSVFGLICNRQITEENVSFFALIVWTSREYSFASWEDTVRGVAYDNAGNWDYDETLGHSPPPNFPIVLRHFSFHNNYEGFIRRFFINAKFENGPYDI